jgi:hypothetical protein
MAEKPLDFSAIRLPRILKQNRGFLLIRFSGTLSRLGRRRRAYRWCRACNECRLLRKTRMDGTRCVRLFGQLAHFGGFGRD